MVEETSTEGIVMLTCEGKPVTLTDLAGAYRTATAREIKRTSNPRNGGKCKGKARGLRFPGLVEHAKRLGVSRIHLYFVLTGQRVSPRISRYIDAHPKLRRAS